MMSQRKRRIEEQIFDETQQLDSSEQRGLISQATSDDSWGQSDAQNDSQSSSEDFIIQDDEQIRQMTEISRENNRLTRSNTQKIRDIQRKYYLIIIITFAFVGLLAVILINENLSQQAIQQQCIKKFKSMSCNSDNYRYGTCQRLFECSKRNNNNWDVKVILMMTLIQTMMIIILLKRQQIIDHIKKIKAKLIN